MIRMTVLYRNSEASTFDFDYYVKTHLELAKERLKEFGVGRIEVERGIEALDGQKAPYVCVAHVHFSSIEDLKRGVEAHAEELLADVPNFTNIEADLQISEVVAS